MVQLDAPDAEVKDLASLFKALDSGAKPDIDRIRKTADALVSPRGKLGGGMQRIGSRLDEVGDGCS